MPVAFLSEQFISFSHSRRRLHACRHEKIREDGLRFAPRFLSLHKRRADFYKEELNTGLLFQYPHIAA